MPLMEAQSESIRDLTQRLRAVEAASQSASDAHVPAALRVCEKLRISLTRFFGADGFTSLMRRAVAVARAEVPSLQNIEVKPDGSLEGFEELAADPGNGGADATFAITAHLLTLLVTFIGKPLTLRLVREAWSDASLDE